MFDFIYRTDPITFLISQSKLQANIVVSSRNIPTKDDDFYNLMEFSPDSKLLKFKAYNPSVQKLWDTSNGKLAHEYNDIVFSPDGRFLASWDGKTIQLWNLNKKELIYSLSKISDKISSMRFSFSPDGNWLSVIYDGKTIGLWNTNTGKLIHSISTDFLEYYSPISSLSFSFRPDSKQFVYIDKDNTIKLCDITNSGNLIINTIKASKTVDINRYGDNYSPDSKWFAYTEDNKIVNLQSPRIRELVAAKKQNAMLESIPFRN